MITSIKCRFSNLLPNPFQQHVNNLKPNVLNEVEPIEPLNAKSIKLCHSMKRKHSYQFKIRSFDTRLCYDAGGKNLGLGKDFANKFYNSNLVALSTAISDGKLGCSTRGKNVSFHSHLVYGDGGTCCLPYHPHNTMSTMHW
ncbi:hypothetical protein T03_5404 [Trichinella britovi]|uniref:Uncharacterized protein n=1 Tax=Trichinella britovi TaxID=45882 RepID=A0A0V1D6F3_TRIBR|nr:hypothetical protein T03_5404 [Trichinella britovi]